MIRFIGIAEIYKKLKCYKSVNKRGDFTELDLEPTYKKVIINKSFYF